MIKQKKYQYKFQGQELQTEFGLDFYDFGARIYEPTLGRWYNIDPLAEQSRRWSPYNFAYNNPVYFIDPDGMSALGFDELKIDLPEFDNPIYDTNGNFLGTDDRGLQGDAIIMNKENFTQGMSHEKAQSYDLGKEGLSNSETTAKLTSHYDGLKNRPDYDGYLTLKEANQWYRNGNGEPLFTDLSKIDLSGISSLGEKYVGQVKTFNLLIESSSLNDGLVYGNITLKRYPNHQVRAFSDRYDFDMHNAKNPLNWGRNFETTIGKRVAGEGTPFNINIYGNTTLKPLFPWTK